MTTVNSEQQDNKTHMILKMKQMKMTRIYSIIKAKMNHVKDAEVSPSDNGGTKEMIPHGHLLMHNICDVYTGAR